MGNFVITALSLVLATASLESAQQQTKSEIRPSDVHPVLHYGALHCIVCYGDLDQASLQNLQQSSKNNYLRDAVITNDLPSVKYWLCEGAQVNVVCMDNKTPLHEAALLGYPEIVRQLLSCADVEMNAESLHYMQGINRCYTPLMFAVSRGKLSSDYALQIQKLDCKVTGAIFKNGLNSGPYATYQPFPIQKGSDADYESIVEQLLQKGALSQDHDKKNEFAIVIAAQHGTLKMVQMLIAAGADLNASMMVERIPEQTTYCGCYEYRYLQQFENVIKIAIDTHNIELLKTVLIAGARADNPIIERIAFPGEFGFLEYTEKLQNPLLYLIHKYDALDALQALPEEERKKVSEIIEELLVHGVAQIDYNHFCDKLRWIGAACALENAEHRIGKELKRVLVEQDYLLPDLAQICKEY